MEHITVNRIRRSSVEGGGAKGSRYNPSIRKTVQIFNEIPYPIGIASREGLKYDLPPGTNFSQNAITICVEYSFNRQAKESLKAVLCSNSVENSPELKLIKDQLSNDSVQYIHNQGKFDVEYVIEEKDLLEHGGIVYIRDLDLVISAKGSGSIRCHPYSREASLYGFSEEIMNDVENNIGQNFIYSLKIIDSFGTIGKRWLRIGDDVVGIDPTSDPSKQDGIYVATNKPSTNNLGSKSMTVERYDVDGIPPYFKLYRHFHDARHTAADEHALKLSEHETRRVKVEADLEISRNTLTKVMQENENLKRAAEINREKHANEMHALRMQLEREIQERVTMQRKDTYEAISQDRKNTAELVKTVPAIILGIIGIVAAAKKMM